ncbi:hypothetical protein PL9631_690008 [Planktothrix paucivesiculata PCC 9631]|uniref:Uncharacterized protein n=1 Tax=Planktothrix paucivesiculata PCC 9631 TaxID=671071 RepID=A0A7Z9BWV1_9CYAN|nr:hypothetical protein PL9631_690008 [Planktothrix paucivesiculata PCC 9631]
MNFLLLNLKVNPKSDNLVTKKESHKKREIKKERQKKERRAVARLYENGI